MNAHSSKLPHSFFLTGGETSRLMNSFDWSETPLGPSDHWPQSLVTTLGILLNSKAPMLLWWGPECIQFYNDAYQIHLKMLGKHPQALGQPISACFPEWEPVVKGVLEGGEALWQKAKKVVLLRNGYAEEVRCDLHYTVILKGPNEAGGVLMTAYESAPGPYSSDQSASFQVLIDLNHALKKAEENEMRLRIAVEAAEIGTFEVDLLTAEFAHSEQMALIFGHVGVGHISRKELIRTIHPEDEPTRVRAHEEALKTGILFYESRLIWPDNSLHWVRVNGKIGYDSTGKPVKIYGTALDITDQKNLYDQLEKLVTERTSSLQKKAEELARSEERYHKMIEEVQDYAIILLDQQGKIVNWNEGAEKIKGYRDEEIIGKSFTLFYLPEDRASNLPEKLMNEAATNGRAMHEGWRLRKDGSRFWGSIVITTLHNDAGGIIGYSKVTRDLTDKKLAEDQLKNYTAELEFQNRELEQFAYIASHDLQEPLRKIRTFGGMLKANLHQKETAELYLSKIDSSTQRMAALIQDVLDYSRLSRIDVPFVPIDLNQILELILIDFELLIEQKEAVITSDFLPVVKGIPRQLSQLFSNLLSNSLKFSEQSPRIILTSRPLPVSEQMRHPELKAGLTYAHLTVKDNGIGFESKYAEQVFTIFQRLNNSRDYSGTGIGLALCKKIVDNHHGLITAESELGKGATFHLYLPV